MAAGALGVLVRSGDLERGCAWPRLWALGSAVVPCLVPLQGLLSLFLCFSLTQTPSQTFISVRNRPAFSGMGQYFRCCWPHAALFTCIFHLQKRKHSCSLQGQQAALSGAWPAGSSLWP